MLAYIQSERLVGYEALTIARLFLPSPFSPSLFCEGDGHWRSSLLTEEDIEEMCAVGRYLNLTGTRSESVLETSPPDYSRRSLM